MSLTEAIILGILQGFTEFLPVSSSGHLVIIEHLMGVKQKGIAFEVFLHFGTLFAVFYVFRRDVLELAADLYRIPVKILKNRSGDEKKSGNLLIMLIIATIVTGIIAVPLKSSFAILYEKPEIAGIMLVFTGLILIYASVIKKGLKSENQIKVSDSLIIGLCQCIAIIPGISRSGATVTGSLARGLDRETAFRFSFLLSIPAILGAFIMEIKGIMIAGMDTGLILPYFAGTLSAAFSGILAIRIFKWMLDRNKLVYFAVYCIVAGIISSLFFLLLYNTQGHLLGFIYHAKEGIII